MKILDKNTGEWKTIQLGGGTIDYDNLPVGSIIDYDGDEVPVGYELSEDGADGGTWIGNDTPTNAYNLWIEPNEVINSATEVVNSLEGNETNLAPSVEAINKAIGYHSQETKTGRTWIDGKPIYEYSYMTNQYISPILTGITSVDSMLKMEVLIKYRNEWREFPWLWVENNSYGNATYSGGCYFTTGDGRVRFQVGDTAKTDCQKIILKMEYTKTTD